jgi:prolyl-tRNA editing enzyme YbaK/EbsC (Cys-tRNA(Pro) deacylase)
VDKRNSRVAAAVAAAGIEPSIRILDADAKTAVAAAHQLGCEVGAIANSLVFECDGEPLLVMSSGAHRVDTGHPTRLRTIVDETLARYPVIWTAAGITSSAPRSAPRGNPSNRTRTATR